MLYRGIQIVSASFSYMPFVKLQGFMTYKFSTDNPAFQLLFFLFDLVILDEDLAFAALAFWKVSALG